MTTQTKTTGTSTSHGRHDDRLALYRSMLLIRRCEEQLAKVASARPDSRRLPHLCRPGGDRRRRLCAHLRTDDVVFSTHRGHGHALAKGVPPRSCSPSCSAARPAVRRGAAAACTCSPPKSA